MFSISSRKNYYGSGIQKIRTDPLSGDIRETRLNDWCIWIHGYNNSQYAANKAWNQLSSELNSKFRINTNSILRYYWPGDQFQSTFFSAFKYPSQIKVAEECASDLTEFISNHAKTLSAPLRLKFIAHSLGCLITLETINRLQNSNVLIEKVLLMAAAVPQGFCDPEVKNSHLATRIGGGCSERVLYSPNDLVLKHFFRVGQKIAQRLPKKAKLAVGYSGGPSTGDENGRTGRWTSSKELHGFGHSDYWKNRVSVEEIFRTIKPITNIEKQALPSCGIREESIYHSKISTSDQIDGLKFPWRHLT